MLQQILHFGSKEILIKYVIRHYHMSQCKVHVTALQFMSMYMRICMSHRVLAEGQKCLITNKISISFPYIIKIIVIITDFILGNEAHITKYINYYYYIHLTAFFQDNLGKLAPER